MTNPQAVRSGAAVSPGQESREVGLTERVLGSFDHCPDPRLRQLMPALVRYLHGFLREVRLTDEEWRKGIEFLTATGHITDDRRQEFILLSDVLGASTQTVAINNAAYGDATEATILGPFFEENSPQFEIGGDITGGAVGEPCWVEGSVVDAGGKPVPGARIEVWENDANGLYDVQYDDHRTADRGHLFTDANGNYSLWATTPVPYPIPLDGPVGNMLAAVGRSPMRAAHLHFMVSAPGCRRLVTQIFVRGDELLDRDSVFGVKASLIKDFEPQPAGTPAPDGRDLGDREWSRVRFDIALAPAEA